MAFQIKNVTRCFNKQLKEKMQIIGLFLTRRPLLRQGRSTGIRITGSASSAPEAGFVRPPVSPTIIGLINLEISLIKEIFEKNLKVGPKIVRNGLFSNGLLCNLVKVCYRNM